jgi:hypothetical protein
MGDDLVPVEIEIDPMVRAAAFGAAEQFAVEAPSGGKVVDRKGMVEGRKAHWPSLVIAREAKQSS